MPKSSGMNLGPRLWKQEGLPQCSATGNVIARELPCQVTEVIRTHSRLHKIIPLREQVKRRRHFWRDALELACRVSCQTPCWPKPVELPAHEAVQHGLYSYRDLTLP
jgi:hypothetical protein